MIKAVQLAVSGVMVNISILLIFTNFILIQYLPQALVLLQVALVVVKIRVEDFDFCKQAKEQGFKVRYYSTIQAKHHIIVPI